MLDGNTAARLSYEGMPVVFPERGRKVSILVDGQEWCVRMPPLARSLQFLRWMESARYGHSEARIASRRILEALPNEIGAPVADFAQAAALVVALHKVDEWTVGLEGAPHYLPAPTHRRALEIGGMLGRVRNGLPGASECLTEALIEDLQIPSAPISPIEAQQLAAHVVWPEELRVAPKPKPGSDVADEGARKGWGLDDLEAEFYAEYGAPAPDLPHPMWLALVNRFPRFQARRELIHLRSTSEGVGAVWGGDTSVLEMRIEELKFAAFPPSPSAEWDGPEMALIQEGADGE